MGLGKSGFVNFVKKKESRMGKVIYQGIEHFPEIQEHIDFATLKPLSEQMYTDLIDSEIRTVDILDELF